MSVKGLFLAILVTMTYLFGARVKASNSSILQDMLLPVNKRHMFDRKHSHHKLISKRTFNEGASLECCPSVTQAIAPLGGLSKDGSLLQLYRDSNTIQKFYETTCVRGVKGRPCDFVNGSEWISRCEQRYTYTYAIVKNFNATEPYRIDYMKIKSGCSCNIK